MARPRRSLILDTIVDAVSRTAVLFAVFLLFAGHNAPGGGFVGGLVIGAALVLRHVAGGVDDVNRVLPVRSSVLLGGGLLLACATAAGGWLWNDELLASTNVELSMPALGTVKLGSALAFDIGVFLVVTGLALAVLRSLGDPRSNA